MIECAGKKDPEATVKVTANTSPKGRQYFIGLEFLDAEGKVVDSSSLKLTPQAGSADHDEVSENVEFPMNEPEKADEARSCKMDHAF